MKALKTIQTRFSCGLSRLVVMLAVSAWMFAVPACLLTHETVAAPLAPTSHAHLAGHTSSGHQDLDHCGLNSWLVDAVIQPVAMAPPIITVAMLPAPVVVVPAPKLADPAGAAPGLSALADTRSRSRYRYFANFWSHAPPTDNA